MDKVDVIFAVFVSSMLSALFTFLIIISLNGNYFIENDRAMVSYEYTTECRCGGTIEGYQSLVDDYNREECNKCGYHKE